MGSEFDHLHSEFNIEDRAFSERFEDVMEHLLSRCPIARSQVGPGYHVFNRYRDVRRIGQDWRTFSSADGWMLDPPEGNIPTLPEDSDPPYHTAWRQVLNPYFSAKAVAKLEDHARGYAGELIDVVIAGVEIATRRFTRRLESVRIVASENTWPGLRFGSPSRNS